jgi:hypothetical protein
MIESLELLRGKVLAFSKRFEQVMNELIAAHGSVVAFKVGVLSCYPGWVDAYRCPAS